MVLDTESQKVIVDIMIGLSLKKLEIYDIFNIMKNYANLLSTYGIPNDIYSRGPLFIYGCPTYSYKDYNIIVVIQNILGTPYELIVPGDYVYIQ